uniref:Gfo/Idh/MocA family oxidoreductase n=1 Tax=Roseihalotalea indica TaxID=2867963 RepID=A0AA49JB54_9BACT|nr:Gfo/Idh/MocA family oxidoreductase [Tunicatimonas sp. TK19036]
MEEKRRQFLKHSLATAAFAMPGSIFGSNLHTTARPTEIKVPFVERSRPKESIRFSVIGLNHGHIYGQVEALLGGGGELVAVYAKEPDLLKNFTKRYPKVKVAKSEDEILEDNSIQLVASAAIPVERAPLGIRVMQHGKDYMVDKPGIVTLEQFEQVKRVQKETERIYSIMYSERLGNTASVKASELVQSGAIGKVVQTIGMGPHRMRPETRPDWFFDPAKAGGILCDIGSHQSDQFLHYTSSTEAEVTASQIGNFNNSKYPNFADFGDMNVRSPQGTGYIRIDWFTPDGLDTWGDGRLFILGTEGYIECRKYIDIAGREGGNHLFLVDQKETKYYDCSNVHLPYGEQLVSDVVNRTETAMTQHHCFLATELALKAQENAYQLNA